MAKLLAGGDFSIPGIPALPRPLSGPFFWAPGMAKGPAALGGAWPRCGPDAPFSRALHQQLVEARTAKPAEESGSTITITN